MTTERGLALLLAAVAWFALALQLWLSLQLGLQSGKGALGGLVAYLGYFTILSNGFVALVATARARGRDGFLARPMAGGCASTAIVVVGLGYHFLLREIWDPQGAQWLADNLLHYAVPLLALAAWCLRRDGARLPAWAPLAWALYPLAYFAYAMLRGHWLGSYPYPFIDVTVLGFGRATLNAAGLLVVFIAVAFAMRALGRVGRGRGEAPAQ